MGHYQPGQQIGPAEWPHFDLLIAYEGDVLLDIAGQSVQLRFGDAVVISPGHRFFGQASSENAMIWVTHFRYPQQKVDVKQQPIVIRSLIAEPFYLEACRRFDQVFNRSDSFARRIELNALLQLMLSHGQALIKASGDQEGSARGFDSILEWAELRIGEGLQVSDLARKAHLSESHFRTRFRQAHGISPSRALLQIRMRRARQLLRDSDLSIKAISSEVGYSDVIAFHRAFQKTGQTPGRYRSACRYRV